MLKTLNFMWAYAFILSLYLSIVPLAHTADVSPQIDITSPLDNFATSQDSIIVEYTFSSNKDNPGQGVSGSVSLIELLINGEVSQTYANSPQVKEGSGSFEVNLNIPDQILRLQTCAYQGDVHAGLKGCSEEVQVYIDKTLPEISLIEVPSSYTNNPQPTFRAGYTDNLSGVDTIKVRLNGEGVTEGLSITEEELFFQPIIPLQDGSYTFEIEVQDKAGNVATNSVNFTIDTVPPEPPSISIDRMIDANPGVLIEEIEGRIIITLRGNQDKVTLIGEESEPGNIIVVDAPAPLIVGEIEYINSFRAEISGIIEGKHIVKVFEKDQAGSESEALITVEIDRLIYEIIDFSDIKVKINRVRGIIAPVLGDYNALPGSPEELTEFRDRLKELVNRWVFRIDSGESAFNYQGYWLSYHEGHIPNIEGITGEEIKEKYEEFVAKLEWVQTPQVTDPYYFRIGNIEKQEGNSGWLFGRSLEEAFNKAVSQWGLSEFIPITYSGGDYGTGISAISHSPESYTVGIYTQNFRGNFELPQNLIVYIPFSNTGGREYWGVPVKVEEYQVSTAGRFAPGWQYIEFIDNEKEIPEIPEGCYYPPYWCGYVYDFRHLHQMVMYARAIPPEVEIEKIEITPKPQDGENAVNICFLSEQQFTAYVHLHLIYTDGSISNTFKVRLPLTSTIGVIDADGTFEAIQFGEGEVKATYGGVTESVKVIVWRVEITASRPQTAPFNFQQHVVPSNKEDNPGAGIRMNGDDDDNDGTPDRSDTSVNNEDDLIKVKLEVVPVPVPSGFEYVLKRSNSNIKVWEKREKETAILDTDDEQVLTFNEGTKEVWVEYYSTNHGTTFLELQVRAIQDQRVICSNKIRFYSFTSVVIALGGEGDEPRDPPDANHGAFNIARDLYLQGYDVHMFDEDVVNNQGVGEAYDEVESAVENRGITQVAIFGYSHGGGSTHDLAERLNNERGTIGNFTISYTAYIDAVMNFSDQDFRTETRRPPSTSYHVNYYQTPHTWEDDKLLGGGPIDCPPCADDGGNVSETTWGANLTHFTIDDHPNVRNGVMNRLKQNVNK